MIAMVAVPIADTAQMKRMTEFAADVLELADERPDLELRELVSLGARIAHRSTLLLMVRIGDRKAAGWLREVVAGRVELVRRDPTRKFARMDGPS